MKNPLTIDKQEEEQLVEEIHCAQSKQRLREIIFNLLNYSKT